MVAESPETAGDSWIARAWRLAASSPWSRLGFLAAVVTLGFSQIMFNVIQNNLDFYPIGAWFFGTVILLVQVLPFAALLVVDTLVLRWTGSGRTLKVWRTTLVTVLFLSLLRQVQVYYPDPFWAIMARVPLLPIAISVTFLVFLLAFRFSRTVHTYLAWLGILAIVQMGLFFGCSDVFGHPGGNIDRPRPEPGAELPDIVLVVFDELSFNILEKDGSINRDRFPNFASLAEESAWFSNASTNHIYTTEAFPTLLTGHAFPSNRPITLFDRLPEAYDVRMRLGSSASYNWIRRNSRDNQKFQVYTWEEKVIGSPLDVPRYLVSTLAETPFSRSPFAAQPALRLAPPLVWEGAGFDLNQKQDAEDFLADLADPAPGPRFLMWHSFLPHFPFTFDVRGEPHDRPHQTFGNSPSGHKSMILAEGARTDDPDGYRPEAVYANYLEQVQYVDRILGRIVDRLKELDRYDRTVLLVTSDHGLRTWGEMEPEGYPEVMGNHTPRVPLFIRGPGISAGKRDFDVQHVDLVPSLMDVLGFPESAKDTEGVSAFSPDRPARPKFIIDSVLGSEPRRYEFDPEADVWRWIR